MTRNVRVNTWSVDWTPMRHPPASRVEILRARATAIPTSGRIHYFGQALVSPNSME